MSAPDKDLLALRDDWQVLAETDPMWAILSADEFRGGRWDPAKFYATGVVEARGVVDELKRRGWLSSWQSALDFGCGVGRVTFGLAQFFAHVDGVDIAPAMVEAASARNALANHCAFHVNVKPDLAIFADDTFDLVYCNIVLQHMPPDLARGFVTEFVRVLRPGGAAWFQLPSHQLRKESASAPLQDGAFRASIECDTPLLELTAEEPFSLTLRVMNAGSHSWMSHPDDTIRPVVVGNHWLDEDGLMRVLDDRRAALPAVVNPGEEVRVDFASRAPSTDGQYVLELDLVQEGVAWFASRGSRSLRIPVVVGAERAATRPIPGREELRADPMPITERPRRDEGWRIKMHGTTPSAVLSWITLAGGEIRLIESDAAAGPEWRSYRYVVTKA